MATTGRLLLLSMLIGLCSCATLANVKQAKNNNEGTSKIYNVDYEKAWKISEEILHEAGCDAIEENKNEGYMLTSFPQQMGGGGVAGVWLDRIDGNTTKVTVVTERRTAINPLTPLREIEFHKEFQEKLDKPL